MGNPWSKRLQAEMNRCDVFSSASNRCCVGFSVTRSADFLGEVLGISQRSLDEHARPVEMARRLFYGFGFLVHGEDFPNGNAMPGQVRFAPRNRITKGNPRELGLEALFDDVSRDEIAL